MSQRTKAVGETISIEEYQRGTKKKHKFSAEHTWINQIRFDSKSEAERYRVLLTLQTHQHRKLRNLQLQRTFEFFAAGIKEDRWRIDFCYEELFTVDPYGNPLTSTLEHSASVDDCSPGVAWFRVAEDPTGVLTTRKKRLIRLFNEQYGLDNNYTSFERWILRIT